MRSRTPGGQQRGTAHSRGTELTGTRRCSGGGRGTWGVSSRHGDAVAVAHDHAQLGGRAVVGVDKKLLKLRNQRVARVSAGALIVKRHRGHHVQLGLKLFPGYARLLQAHGQPNRGLKLLKAMDQRPHLLLGAVRVLGELEHISDLGIRLQRDGVLVLRKGSHLGRRAGGVEGDNMGEHDGVGGAVGDMELRAQLVSARVADTQECVGEGHARNGRPIVHVLTRNLVVAIEEDGLQVRVDEPDGLHRLRLGEVGGDGGHKALHCVNQGVVAGGGGQAGGHSVGEVRVDDGHLGGERVIADGVLAAVGASHHGERCHLGSGAAGSGHADQVGNLRPQSGEVHNALADVHESGGEALHGDLGLLIHEAHHLGGVHR
mmetsp:Transcript_3950/g.7227  ORF Transcript_3950/g.7227 Transcript_3950/m.7227 type:complete len:374 (+) Transcript_3950:353-1474(+)